MDDLDDKKCLKFKIDFENVKFFINNLIRRICLEEFNIIVVLEIFCVLGS